METIKIYYNPQKILRWLLGVIPVFISIIIFSPDEFRITMGWICGIGIVLIVIGNSILLIRMKKKPYLTITNEAIFIINGIKQKQKLILFSDVESFELTGMDRGEMKVKYIAVHYRPEVWQQKLDEANAIDRHILKQNGHDVIIVTGLDIKEEEVCNLLNERLKLSSK